VREVFTIIGAALDAGLRPARQISHTGRGAGQAGDGMRRAPGTACMALAAT
jgi:hypothetical protein